MCGSLDVVLASFCAHSPHETPGFYRTQGGALRPRVCVFVWGTLVPVGPSCSSLHRVLAIILILPPITAHCGYLDGWGAVLSDCLPEVTPWDVGIHVVQFVGKDSQTLRAVAVISSLLKQLIRRVHLLDDRVHVPERRQCTTCVVICKATIVPDRKAIHFGL